MLSEESKKEIQKLILEEMDYFLRKHKATITKRALKKWKERQQEMSSKDVESELQELD